MTYGPVARITTQLHPRQKNVPAPAGTGGKLKAELEHGSSTALERFLMLGAQIVVQKSISALIKKKKIHLGRCGLEASSIASYSFR